MSERGPGRSPESTPTGSMGLSNEELRNGFDQMFPGVAKGAEDYSTTGFTMDIGETPADNKIKYTAEKVERVSMAEKMQGLDTASVENAPEGPEALPTNSLEVEAALSNLEALEKQYDAYKSQLDKIYESCLAIGGTDDMPKEYLERLSNEAKRMYQDIELQKAALEKLREAEKESEEAGIEEEMAAEGPLENAAKVEADAEGDPEKTEKVSRWKKFGAWMRRKAPAFIVGVGVGAAIAGGISSANNNSDFEESLQSSDGMAQEYEAGRSGLDIAMDNLVSQASVESWTDNLEALEREHQDYIDVDYGYFSNNKESHYAFAPRADMLDDNYNLIGETGAENHELAMKEWDSIGRRDPHRLAVAYTAMTEVGPGGKVDYSSVEQLEDIFLSNPELQEANHQELLEFFKNADFTTGSLEGMSYYSMYNVVGEDGTPELIQTYIENGSGTYAKFNGTYKDTAVEIMFRLDCGWQVISVEQIQGVNVVAEEDIPTPPPTIVDPPEVPDFPTPETPDPEPEPEPEPTPETPDPEPEPEPTPEPEPEPTPEPDPKVPEKDINANDDLPEDIQMGDDRVDSGPLQDEGEVTPPPAEYVPPAPTPEQVPVAPEATPITPEERQDEIDQAPVVPGANTDIPQDRQDELADSGAGELDGGQGNDGRVDG